MNEQNLNYCDVNFAKETNLNSMACLNLNSNLLFSPVLNFNCNCNAPPACRGYRAARRVVPHTTAGLRSRLRLTQPP